MMILGIGTDIVECPRIGKMIEQHGELFLRRVYTEREIRYCQSRKHAIEHFAGRWAAKEAILKAMGTGRSQGISWTDIEVRNGQDGQPQVMVCGAAEEIARERGIGDILISISHCRTYATAYAMALGRPATTPPRRSPQLPPSRHDATILSAMSRRSAASTQRPRHDSVDLGQRGLARLLGALALGVLGAAQEEAAAAAADDHRAAAIVAGLLDRDRLQVGARGRGRSRRHARRAAP